jgi:hypothetical protein
MLWTLLVAIEHAVQWAAARLRRKEINGVDWTEVLRRR